MSTYYQPELETMAPERLREMQSENCSIDNLSALTSRSLELLKVCKAKLQSTDAEVKKILATLEESQQ